MNELLNSFSQICSNENLILKIQVNNVSNIKFFFSIIINICVIETTQFGNFNAIHCVFLKVLWGFDTLYSLGLSRPRTWQPSYQYKKKPTYEWHINKNQILWFVSSFAHIVALWSCLWPVEHKSFDDITPQTVNCWIEIQRTIFFSWKVLYDESKYLIVQ